MTTTSKILGLCVAATCVAAIPTSGALPVGRFCNLLRPSEFAKGEKPIARSRPGESMKQKPRGPARAELKGKPTVFRDFAECVTWLKRSVYMIARGRKTIEGGKEYLQWTTLGTGFVAGPNRFLTASHVINDVAKGEMYEHKPGDIYYFIRHDDENHNHFHITPLELNQDLFLYPDLDLAVIYLKDTFYKVGDVVYANKSDYIGVSGDLSPIGTEIGVLGYPLVKLEFENRDLANPRSADILMRTDRGVVNTRYQTSPSLYVYEFTLAFNPGNSGGPIFDVRTGRAISLVRGYKTITLQETEKVITEEGAKTLKVYKEGAYIDVVHATYSFGIATRSFIEVLRKHGISN